MDQRATVARHFPKNPYFNLVLFHFSFTLINLSYYYYYYYYYTTNGILTNGTGIGAVELHCSFG